MVVQLLCQGLLRTDEDPGTAKSPFLAKQQLKPTSAQPQGCFSTPRVPQHGVQPSEAPLCPGTGGCPAAAAASHAAGSTGTSTSGGPETCSHTSPAAGREGRGARHPSKQISNAAGLPELPGSVHAVSYAGLESDQFHSKQNIFLPSPRTISNTSLKCQKLTQLPKSGLNDSNYICTDF